MYELIVQSHFDAAHFLRDYPGKCANVHGHTWQVELAVGGTQLDSLGILVDFYQLKTQLNKVCDSLDHRMINEQEPFLTQNPTAENLSRYFYESLTAWLKTAYPGNVVRYVRVWESPKASVRYIPEGAEGLIP
ncbi:6-carboxytetrahydropterin synthase QueD [Heliophilum fasciatum]|uniref:6-carboxy-5,6,7,8-tetrahydropterin synthase n=1 Tax=Heliophilum fasciatum TaxID=35700 RepID=A0A4R2S7P2_9FIRM|nr:6-carboxytetrahydropterin synthase QueD [Heliophilum fasciatum]MCW2277419.1 6-pyruvoyltetrahydropterin/6-carboxytetrahydropterin synthase [Heliophilum fasciatum]TCP67255.1 preQ(0) biosynthesis protein QueD [Heliophilum fasciatum]